MRKIPTLFFAALAVAATSTAVLAADYDRYERGYPPPSSPPPRAAYARPPQHAVHGQPYFFAHVGGFEPNDNHDGLEGFDSGGAFDLGIGSRVTPFLAIEGTFGGYRAEENVFNDEITVAPLTFGARLILPHPVIEPYVGGGLGFYFATLDAPGFADDSDTTVGGYISLGLDAWLNPRVALNFEGRYHMAEPRFQDYSGTSFDLDVSGWTVGMGVRVGF